MFKVFFFLCVSLTIAKSMDVPIDPDETTIFETFSLGRTALKDYENQFCELVWGEGVKNGSQVNSTLEKSPSMTWSDKFKSVNKIVLHNYVGIIHILPEKAPGEIFLEFNYPSVELGQNLFVNNEEGSLHVGIREPFLFDGNYACIYPCEMARKMWHRFSYFFGVVHFSENERLISMLKVFPKPNTLGKKNEDLSSFFFIPETYVLKIYMPSSLQIEAFRGVFSGGESIIMDQYFSSKNVDSGNYLLEVFYEDLFRNRGVGEICEMNPLWKLCCNDISSRVFEWGAKVGDEIRNVLRPKN